jgi:Peptidase family M41
MTQAELLDRLDVLLGGRAAEDIIFGDISTGAQDDLQRGTDIAHHMLTQYAMNKTVGLATLDGPRPPQFLQIPVERPACSEETSRLIDEQTRTMLDEAYVRARETLLAKRSILKSLVRGPAGERSRRSRHAGPIGVHVRSRTSNRSIATRGRLIAKPQIEACATDSHCRIPVTDRRIPASCA